MGIGADHHHPVASTEPSSEAATTVEDSEHHDCTGQPRPQFVDSSRTNLKHAEIVERPGTIASISDSRVDSFEIPRRFDRGLSSPVVAHALSLPALQVYRL